MNRSPKDSARLGASAHLRFPLHLAWFLCPLTLTLHMGLVKASWLFLGGTPKVALPLLIML